MNQITDQDEISNKIDEDDDEISTTETTTTKTIETTKTTMVKTTTIMKRPIKWSEFSLSADTLMNSNTIDDCQLSS
ncbi:hypothetical protein DERP_012803 [Dermatophagoides pteronyssinus]|uniref:Uncharacterized protein n=1 Tax=Dermatophagoides pteronyssinus TaxID=6956 RepID=A0ABQ8JFP5_DERPT|nr:hypothetical protein DERP_012803 [Dermatophagoides pteronyssinus]